jgi:TRAP-type C4-dicarboxylate transport system substrate-binding protein
MAERIAERTDGKFNIRVVMAKELGIDRDEFSQALAEGTIEMAMLYNSVMGGIFPFLGVFNLPYLTTDQRSCFLVEEAIRAMFFDALKDSGYLVIPPDSFHCWPPQDILSREPIPNLADLSGLKVRVWRDLDGELIRALGGEAVYMPVAEVYVAMQRGVMDALNTGPQSMVANSMWEIGKHYYAVRLEPGGCWNSVNEEEWASLPNEYKMVLIEENATTIQTLQNQYDGLSGEKKAVLAEHGVIINEPSQAEIDAWRNVAFTIWDKWAKEDPQNQVALDLAKKALGL